MKPKTQAMLVSLGLAAVLAGCGQGAVNSSQDATPTPMVQGNNPFVYNIDYDVKQSFGILEGPYKDVKGTVDESYLGIMNVPDSDGSHLRIFSWLVMKDQMGEDYYFIYPAEKVFPPGKHITVDRYWKIREGTRLMNNMLVYITMGKATRGYNDWSDYNSTLDFPLQSSAPDGHVDGLIELDAYEYIHEVNP
jgi:hypothetical protein